MLRADVPGVARVIGRVFAAAAVLAACSCTRATDADLQAAAIVRLRMDPRTARLPIEVAVENRNARITGETDSRADQEHAIAVVKAVEGIASVVNDVRLSDRSIELEVRRVLEAEPMLAGVAIDVSVNRGVVRLESGDTDRLQRARAIGTTAQVDGVIKVEDYMR